MTHCENKSISSKHCDIWRNIHDWHIASCFYLSQALQHSQYIESHYRVFWASALLYTWYLSKVHKFMTNGAKSSILRVHLDFSTLSWKFYTNGVTGITDKYQVYPLEEHTPYSILANRAIWGWWLSFIWWWIGRCLIWARRSAKGSAWQRIETCEHWDTHNISNTWEQQSQHSLWSSKKKWSGMVLVHDDTKSSCRC